jgi:pilus assembly protein CpaC
MLLGAVLSAGGTALAEDNDINIGTGTQKILAVSGVQRIALGDPSVADVKVINNNQILLSGTAKGYTSLIIWRNNGQRLQYRVHTNNADLDHTPVELKQLLGSAEDIRVRMVGENILLEGTAYSTEDLLRLREIAVLYPNVHNFVRTAPTLDKVAASQLTAALQKEGLGQVQVRVVGTTIFLEGSVENEADIKRAEVITRAMIRS